MLRRLVSIFVIVLFFVFSVCPSFAANGNFYDTISQASDNQDGIYSDESNDDYSILARDVVVEKEAKSEPGEDEGTEIPMDLTNGGDGEDTDTEEGGEVNDGSENENNAQTEAEKIVTQTCNDMLRIISSQFGFSSTVLGQQFTDFKVVSFPPRIDDPPATNNDGGTDDPPSTNNDGGTDDPPSTNNDGGTDDPPSTNNDGGTDDPPSTNNDGGTDNPPSTNNDGGTDNPPSTNNDDGGSNGNGGNGNNGGDTSVNPFDVDTTGGDNSNDGNTETTPANNDNSDYKQKIKNEFNIEIENGTSTWDENTLKITYETLKSMPDAYRALVTSIKRYKDTGDIQTHSSDDGTVLAYVFDLEREIHLLDSCINIGEQARPDLQSQVANIVRVDYINAMREDGKNPTDAEINEFMNNGDGKRKVTDLTNTYVKQYAEETMKHTLLHETAHCLHNTYPKYYRQWQQQFWPDGKASPGCPSKYGETNVGDDLAESFAYYLYAGGNTNDDGSITVADMEGTHTISSDRVAFIKNALEEIDKVYKDNGNSHQE